MTSHFMPSKAYPLDHPNLKEEQDRRIKDDVEAWLKAGNEVVKLGWGDKSQLVDNRKKTRKQRAFDLSTKDRPAAIAETISLDEADAEMEES